MPFQLWLFSNMTRNIGTISDGDLHWRKKNQTFKWEALRKSSAGNNLWSVSRWAACEQRIWRWQDLYPIANPLSYSAPWTKHFYKLIPQPITGCSCYCIPTVTTKGGTPYILYLNPHHTERSCWKVPRPLFSSITYKIWKQILWK